MAFDTLITEHFFFWLVVHHTLNLAVLCWNLPNITHKKFWFLQYRTEKLLSNQLNHKLNPRLNKPLSHDVSDSINQIFYIFYMTYKAVDPGCKALNLTNKNNGIFYTKTTAFDPIYLYF